MDHPAPRRSGIDSLLCDLAEIRRLAGRRVGILTNDACRAADGTTTAAALQHAFSQFADTSGLCLLSAEHGATVQAPAGTPVADTIHPATGLSVHSLYGPARPTTMAHARQLETVIIDVRDIGVRCYTYATTAAELIAGLRGSNTEVIVCDRANPLAVTREIGPPPSIDLRSFLAFLEVPFVHRRSIGRLLGDFHAKLRPDRPPLCIIPYQTPSGSNPGPWVPPSPALDHADAVQLYPGLVL